MRGLVYRPIYVGGNPDDKYKSLANKMVKDLMRDGLKKDVFTDGSIIIIAKVIGNIKKVIFISLGKIIFIYTKQVTVDNVLTIGGWSGKALKAVGTLDFNDLADANIINSINYGWFLNGQSFMAMKYTNSTDKPPIANYPIKSNGKVTVGDNEGYTIDPAETAIFGNYDGYLRGAEKDFVYTTSRGTFVGDGYDPNIWYKDRADETNTWRLVVALPRPAVSGNTLFPTWVRDDRVSFSPEENIYIVSDDALGFSYWEIWKISTGTPSTTIPLISFGRDIFGGSSDMNFGSISTNYVDDSMAFCLSEWRDVAGDVSDAEIFFEATGGYLFEFYPGDYLGYSGRTDVQEKRLARCWMIDVGIYGYFAEQSQSAPDPADNIPGGLFMIDTTSGFAEVTLIYACPPAFTLASLVINQNDPNEILLGETERIDPNGVNQKMYHFKMKEAEQVLVGEGFRQLSGATFVR